MPDNQDRFDALQDQYGGKEQIPNEALYTFLLEVKEDLINVAKLGLDHIPNSPLGKEVRRRCLSDIKWLARYFLWDVISLSTKGSVGPVEENIFLDPIYDVVFDMFAPKDSNLPIHKLSPVKTRVLLWQIGRAHV